MQYRECYSDHRLRLGVTQSVTKSLLNNLGVPSSKDILVSSNRYGSRLVQPVLDRSANQLFLESWSRSSSMQLLRRRPMNSRLRHRDLAVISSKQNVV